MTSDLYRVLWRSLRVPFLAAGVLLAAQGVVFASSQDDALTDVRVYEFSGRRWLELPSSDVAGKRCLLIGGCAASGVLRNSKPTPIPARQERLAVHARHFGSPFQLCVQSQSGAWRFGPIANLSSITGQLLQARAVVVSEFMANPSSVPDHKGEWIELENRLPHRVNLEGWRLRDLGGDFHTLNVGGQGLWVARGGRLVLGRSADLNLNGGVPVDYVMSGFSLNNHVDEIFLELPSGELSDAVLYSQAMGWPVEPGMASNLSPALMDTAEADDPHAWCALPWGSPSLFNPECP